MNKSRAVGTEPGMESGFQPRVLTRRVLTRREEQSHQVSRLLHDELGQSMTVLRLQLAILEMSPELKQAENQQYLKTSVKMVESVIEDLRTISRLLYPTALEATSLDQALYDCCQRVADQTNKTVRYRGSSSDLLPGYMNVLIYRLAQETITCLANMEETCQVSVQMDQDAEQAVLIVQASHQSLQNAASRVSVIERNPIIEDMRDQIELLGGMLRVEIKDGVSTLFSASIPLPEDL